MKELFAELQINCVLDVGAHHGEYASFLREIGYTKTILSFEPTPDSLSILRARAQSEPNWKVLPYALSDNSGQREFHIFQHSKFNSLEDASEYGSENYGLHVKQSVVVETRRLDDILASLVSGIDNPRVYLKMDTQGHDRHVLDGASGVLSGVLALQTEIGARRIYSGTDSFGQLQDYFQALGYLPTGFYPVNKERDGLIVVEWDCVMARTQTAG
ncbi:MAG: FkbM family methyltransferase [Acidobacteria bacterium]|nr:FkbM family methyltransferase [Acidobacteriota bacterium]